MNDDNCIDPTGVKLTPSWHGKDCLGNGEHPGIECCCDECAWYLECWPDYQELAELLAAPVRDQLKEVYEASQKPPRSRTKK